MLGQWRGGVRTLQQLANTGVRTFQQLTKTSVRTSVLTPSLTLIHRPCSSVYLWKNEEKPNTTFVEDQLQERYHDLGLPRRLHRCVGMGNNDYDEPEAE